MRLVPIFLATLLLGACAGHPVQSPSQPTPPPKAAAEKTKPPARAPSASPVAPPKHAGPSIHFATGSFRIDEDARRLLRDIAGKLKGDIRADVTLVGHTDDLGSTEFDIALAQRRVEAVAAELVALGVSSRQIRRVSYGNEAAAKPCASAACRQAQRRVDVIYSGD